MHQQLNKKFNRIAIGLTLTTMSHSISIPVATGLVVGIGFVVIFSLALTDNTKEPTMFLTTNDRKSYRAYNNVYCGQVCDFLAYARVAPPIPQIQISKESDLVFRATNTFGCPKAIHFIVQSHDENSNAVGFNPPKRDNGKYYIPASFTSGNYILNVLADWDNENQDLSTSLHQFKIVIN